LPEWDKKHNPEWNDVEMMNLWSKVIKYNSKHYDSLGSFEAINTIDRYAELTKKIFQEFIVGTYYLRNTPGYII
jgi:hypothetical protein